MCSLLPLQLWGFQKPKEGGGCSLSASWVLLCWVFITMPASFQQRPTMMGTNECYCLVLMSSALASWENNFNVVGHHFLSISMWRGIIVPLLRSITFHTERNYLQNSMTGWIGNGAKEEPVPQWHSHIIQKYPCLCLCCYGQLQHFQDQQHEPMSCCLAQNAPKTAENGMLKTSINTITIMHNLGT